MWNSGQIAKRKLRLNLGRSSFSETIENSCSQYHRYCSKGFKDVCPDKYFCVDCSREKSVKVTKWYHFALLANLYFDIPLRTKLVWSYTTTSRRIVGKWNPRQLVGNKNDFSLTWQEVWCLNFHLFPNREYVWLKDFSKSLLPKLGKSSKKQKETFYLWTNWPQVR